MYQASYRHSYSSMDERSLQPLVICWKTKLYLALCRRKRDQRMSYGENVLGHSPQAPSQAVTHIDAFAMMFLKSTLVMTLFKSVVPALLKYFYCISKTRVLPSGDVNPVVVRSDGSERRFPNFFELDPNLSLVNISRPKTQTAHFNMKEISIVRMIFADSC